MATMRDQLVSAMAARDRYSSLYRHLLSVRPEPEWRTTFGELEAILGYRAPDPARLRRPLWSIPEVGTGHNYPPARQAAGLCPREANIDAGTKGSVCREVSPTSAGAPAKRRFSIQKVLPPHDPGPWPEGFMVSRVQIYDDMGRLTGGSEDMPGNDH